MRISTVMLVSASAVAILCAALGTAWAQEGPPPPAGGPPSQATPGAPPPPGGEGGPPPPPAADGGLPPLPGGPGGPPLPTGPQLTLADIVVRELPPSAARGAPFPPIPDQIVGADLKGASGMPGPVVRDGREAIGAENGATPPGITPLERDIFTSDDFYKDRDLWSDPRYYRCNSAWGIESTWGSYEAPTVGDDPPRTIAWGYCDRDLPRDQIVSPYPYRTAQEHYEALKAEAESRGGPTQYSRDNPAPDWSGSYNVGFGVSFKTRSWIQGAITQMPTYLSVLTPEYQQRMVQQMWHDAHNEVIWPAAFCWPDGFTRRWHGPSGGMMLVTPDLVEISGGSGEKIVTDIYIGREFDTSGSVPNLSGDVRQYYGDSVGFWDGEVLVSWTSNVKHWITHGWFENSDQFQAIEIFSPIDDKDGNFVGLVHETIMYDPEAFAEPVRVAEYWQRQSTIVDGRKRTWAQCFQNLFIIDGQQSAASPGDVVAYTVPDMSGRPWADVWAASEQNMERPKENDVLSNF